MTLRDILSLHIASVFMCDCVCACVYEFNMSYTHTHTHTHAALCSLCVYVFVCNICMSDISMHIYAYVRVACVRTCVHSSAYGIRACVSVCGRDKDMKEERPP